jgi:hypothetical protein
MHEIGRGELIAELSHMQQHGTSMSMLVMTVRNTSNGLLAGVVDGVFSLDYPIAGWLDFLRTQRFKSFCKRRGFPARRERWGSERVIRASIGSKVAEAGEAIDACFLAVYGDSGSFGLELRGFGWQPSNNSLEGDACKATRASG